MCVFLLTQAKWDFALAQRIWETEQALRLGALQTQLWNRSSPSAAVNSRSALGLHIGPENPDSLENLASPLVAGASKERVTALTVLYMQRGPDVYRI